MDEQPLHREQHQTHQRHGHADDDVRLRRDDRAERVAMRTPNMDDDSMSPAMTRSMPLNGSAFPAALAGRDCSV